jgi:hypothetical protein
MTHAVPVYFGLTLEQATSRAIFAAADSQEARTMLFDEDIRTAAQRSALPVGVQAMKACGHQPVGGGA